MSSIVSTSSGDSSFVGKEGYLSLLGEVGKAVAVGSEPGEDVDEISTGYLDLKVRTFRRKNTPRTQALNQLQHDLSYWVVGVKEYPRMYGMLTANSTATNHTRPLQKATSKQHCFQTGKK